MIEIVWEFIVKEEIRIQFELAYGPGGAWSKLFGKSPGFRGTTVMRETENPRRYLVIDLWDTKTLWDQALVERKIEYSDLEATFDEWTESKSAVGTFRVLTQATVRPLGKAGRSSRQTSR